MLRFLSIYFKYGYNIYDLKPFFVPFQVKGENEPHSRHGFAGTPCYMSPEVRTLQFLVCSISDQKAIDIRT